MSVKIHSIGTYAQLSRLGTSEEKQMAHRREVKAIHYEIEGAPAAAGYAATQIPTKDKCHA